MNELLNQFEKETGNGVDFCGPKIYRDKYVQWLETKLAQKPKSEALKEAAEEWAGWTTIANGPKHTAIAAFIAGAEWLENKLAQKPEVSEGTLIRPKDIADRLLRLGYRGVSDGIDDNIRGIQRLLWHNFENSDGQDIESTAEQIADKITDIIIILDQS